MKTNLRLSFEFWKHCFEMFYWKYVIKYCNYSPVTVGHERVSQGQILDKVVINLGINVHKMNVLDKKIKKD